MNSLALEGVVVVGGPLEGTREVLLVARGESADAIRCRLADDPWSASELLQIGRVARWTVRLGSLG